MSAADDAELRERHRRLSEELVAAGTPPAATPVKPPPRWVETLLHRLESAEKWAVKRLNPVLAKTGNAVARFVRRRTKAQLVLWPLIALLLAAAMGPFLWALALHGVYLASDALNTHPEAYLAELETRYGTDRDAFFANVRNLGLIALGILGTVLAVWRSVLAHQAHKLSEKGLIIDRYQKGAQMLESSELSVRLAGIYALRELAQSDPEDAYILVQDLLFDFVRERSKVRKADVSKVTKANPKPGYGPFPPDLQKAMETASWLRKSVPAAGRLETQQRWNPDLRLANLTRVILRRSDLSGADLTGADLSGANLSGAGLTGATLFGATLTGAHLKEAHLN